MSKRIGRSSIIGEQGIAHIRRTVLDMGHMFYETGGVEAGIDGYIELRDHETGQVGNLILQVQGKATERERLPAETPDSFEWPCTEADIRYWRQGTAPVLLVIVQTKTNRAYWKSVRDYFADADAMRRHSIVFDRRNDVFDVSARAAISAVAASTKPGAIAPPTRVAEHLVSNLVPIERFGSKLFLAETNYEDNKQFGAASRSLMEDVPGEWIVKNGRVLSFHDLDDQPWSELCDHGTVEVFDSSEWAYTTDTDRQRDFVQLLNRSLREIVRDDLVFDRDRHVFYFRPLDGRRNRSFSYRAFRKSTARNVVKFYSKKKSPTETAYCRHSAFGGSFRRFGATWYLEITPTYYFTSNGRSEDRFAHEHLKKIKELENNGAVLGQFTMWHHYLAARAKGDMYTPRYPYLAFGGISDYAVEHGVPDGLWLSKEPGERAVLFDDKVSE